MVKDEKILTQGDLKFTRIDESNATVTATRNGREYSMQMLVFTQDEIKLMRELRNDYASVKK